MRLEPDRRGVERVPGAAETALHFVGDQQCAGAVAGLHDRGGKCRRERPYAAFALNRLGDDRRRCAATRRRGAPTRSFTATKRTPGSSGSNGAR